MTEKVTSPKTYFTSLTVENLRCFAGRQELRLTDQNGRPSAWTLILGENGVGKTTLLECLARMRPTPGERANTVQPELAGEESNDILDRYIRDGANVTLNLQASFVAGVELGAAHMRMRPFNTSLELKRYRRKFSDLSVEGSSTVYLEVEPYILGYGAARHTPPQSSEFAEPPGPLASLFDDSTEFLDAEAILTQLDYASLKNDKRAIRLLEKLKKALVDILPDINSVDDIQFLGPRTLSGVGVGGRSGVHIKTPYGTVRALQLSLGSQTTMAWTVDLAWRMLQRYPKSSNPLSEPAIVLIDEIDLHLHPSWQREIRTHLATHFPNIQFVATAHSPLMAQTSLDANLAVLRREGDHVVIENDPAVVRDWRVDQILTSELFGLGSARPLEIEMLLVDRARILRKRKRSPEEKERLAQIEKRLQDLPTMERSEDEHALDIIRRAASALSKSQHSTRLSDS